MIKIKKIIFLVLITLICAEKGNAKISDSLFMTVGNKPITQSDIVNEIKIILILSNESYSNEKSRQLQELAVKSIIKRSIKQIELDRNNYFNFNERDLKNELIRLGSNIDLDLETLKNVFASNELDFSIVEDQIKIELFWNSLIFQLYKNRISINPDEMEEKLKSMQNDKNIEEYLISEILAKVAEKDKIENEIIMSEKVKSAIVATPVGDVSEPILLPEGILIFKIRDKRKVKNNINLEEAKNQLINSEKTRILQMYSLSHYDKLRRSVSIKFFND